VTKATFFMATGSYMKDCMISAMAAMRGFSPTVHGAMAAGLIADRNETLALSIWEFAPDCDRL
jgi:hypothetical protein